jgi:hypothetical protein
MFSICALEVLAKRSFSLDIRLLGAAFMGRYGKEGMVG